MQQSYAPIDASEKPSCSTHFAPTKLPFKLGTIIRLQSSKSKIILRSFR